MSKSDPGESLQKLSILADFSIYVNFSDKFHMSEI
jgi:hypothetical protein